MAIQHIGIIQAFLATIGWGFVYAANQKLLQIYPFYLIIIVESILSLVIAGYFYMYPASWIPNSVFEMTWNGLWWLVGLAVVVFISRVFIVLSIMNCTANVASAIEATYPVFVVMFSYILFRTVPSFDLAIGIGCILTGVFFVLRSI